MKAQEVSEGNNISNMTRDYSCGILEKNMAVFYLCLKDLPEVKLRSFRLISLEKVISRQPSTD